MVPTVDPLGMRDNSVMDEVGDVAVDTEEAQPTTSRRAGIITLVVVVLAMLVVLGVFLAPKGKPADGVLPPDPAGFAAPAIDLPRLDGQGNLSLAELKGTPVVLNFWASWCTTCKDEAPTLVASEAKWRDKGVVFLGVDSVDKNDGAKAFEKTYGITYPSVVNPDGSVAAKWRVTAYPETFFIGRDGRIVSAVRNGVDAATLDENIAKILN